MEIKNKKTLVAVTLASVLVGGAFAILPQSASADLTNLDKFGTIINLLTNILTEVTETNDDLQLKKRFYQFVYDDTPITLGEGDRITAKVRVVSCAPELLARNACAFNVESILVESDIESNSDLQAFLTGPRVDGIDSDYIAFLGGGQVLGILLLDNKTNFLLDAMQFIDGDLSFDGEPKAIGPPGVVGASEEVAIIIRADRFQQGDIKITKIEFNGEQPQGIELELVVETP